jgi:hypothetical protein
MAKMPKMPSSPALAIFDKAWVIRLWMISSESLFWDYVSTERLWGS